MIDTRSPLQIRRDMIARPKGVIPHICETPDCPYTGKPSPDSCACHLTEIACLLAVNAELLALVEDALAGNEPEKWNPRARAVLAKAKGE